MTIRFLGIKGILGIIIGIVITVIAFYKYGDMIQSLINYLDDDYEYNGGIFR